MRIKTPSVISGDTKSGLWWEAKADKVAAAVQSLAQSLWEKDTDRRNEVEVNMRLYSGRNFTSSNAGSYASARPNRAGGDTLRLNVVKAAVDTICAKVGKNRPRPTFLTDGGNWGLRQRAKKLQQFADGAYHQSELYQLAPESFRDAMVGGTGVLYFFHEARKLRAERVFPLEMLVDHVEAVNGDPQSLYRVRTMNRDVLAKISPKHAKDILAAEDVTEWEGEDDGEKGSSRMVKVVEAWHLASWDEKAEEYCPGRHVVAVGNTAIVDEEWSDDTFPFEFFHWSKPQRGFWGDSAVGEIKGIQKEVNTLIQKVQRAMKLVGQPWILRPVGSAVDNQPMPKSKLTNETALIIDYGGPTPPTVVTHLPISPQLLEHVWSLYAKAFEILGSNEMAASATKPPGIDSGRALEQLSEEHLVRFETVSRHFEHIVGNRAAYQFIRLGKQLNDVVPGGYKLQAVKGRSLLIIKWSECEIPTEDFLLQVFPTSVLPHLPAGRTAEVERWQANQWIDVTQAQQLLDFPDLREAGDINTADRELLDYQLEKMLGDGEMVEPDEHQDLQRAAKWANLAYLKAAFDGTPEAHREKLRAYLDIVQDLIEQMAAESAPPPAANPAGMAPQPGAMPPMAPGGMMAGPVA